MMLACLISCALAGCANDDEKHKAEFPKVWELRSHVSYPLDTQPASVAVVAKLLAWRVPVDVDLSKAWAVCRQNTIAAEALAKWQANGLNVAVLDVRQYQDFAGTIPNVASMRLQSMILRDAPVPLALVPALSKPVSLRLTLGREKEDARLFVRGRFQFLLRIAGQSDGVTIVELTPHHNLPIQTIRVRPIDELDMDGPRFDALTMQVPLSRGQVLVIGAFPTYVRSWEIKPPESGSVTGYEPGGKTESNSPKTEGAAPSSQPATTALLELDRLGTAMLTTTEWDRHVQLLVAIGVDAPPSTTTHPAP